MVTKLNAGKDAAMLDCSYMLVEKWNDTAPSENNLEVSCTYHMTQQSQSWTLIPEK